MMDFEEFKANVAEQIRDYLPEKYEDAKVSLNEVTKNNDRQLTGLLIKEEDSNIAPNIYLENFYDQYTDGKDMESILKDIAEVRVKHELGQDLDVSRITDFDQVKDHVICKLINDEMNQDYLADKPHTAVEDLAVMYAVDLGGDKDGRMTAPITNDLMERYGVSTEELHDIAMYNLSESQIEFKSMRDVMVEMMFPDGLREDDPRALMLPPEEETPSMYVLSNSEKINGASAILDSKTMEDISEKLGGDFVVLPSSIHEVIILPVDEDTDRKTLESMVQTINAGEVSPEERLSDHVYMYDSQEKELVLADKFEERRQERETAGKDVKTTEQRGADEKADRGEKKPERERVSMKQKLPEKKAEVTKNEASREHPVPSKTKETALG